MNTYMLIVRTAVDVHTMEYTANDLDHAVKKVGTDYIKGDQFVFRTARKYTAVSRHAVLEVSVEEVLT